MLLDVKPVAHLRKYTLTLTILILPVIINALEKKMAASVGEKPTLSKPVMMMMMVSTKLLLTSSIIIEELFYLLDKL